MTPALANPAWPSGVQPATRVACVDLRSTGRQVVRPALLWHDTRSAGAAADLVAELGDGDVERGAGEWAQAVGSVPVAAFTVTKLRWLAEHEAAAMARTVAVCLPHDWLTWKPAGTGGPRTDRSDASGTGYWSAATGHYRLDLLHRAAGRDLAVPRVLGPAESAGEAGRARLGAGAGDNAAAALGLGSRPGDVVVSIGTSGTVFSVRPSPPPTRPAPSPGSLTRPGASCRWSARSTRPRSWSRRHPCLAWTSTTWPNSRWPPRPAPEA